MGVAWYSPKNILNDMEGYMTKDVEGEQKVAPDDPFAHCLRKRISKREAIRRWGKAARKWLYIWTDEGVWMPLHDFKLNFAGYGLGMPEEVPASTDKEWLLDLRTDKKPVQKRKVNRFDPATGYDAEARAAILNTLPRGADPDAVMKELEAIARAYLAAKE
jgi:hypothetical protein